MQIPFAFLGAPGPVEMIIILVIAVLLFGKRLPDVGRSLGKGLVEFKRGVRGIEDEVNSAASSTAAPASADEVDDRDEATAPKFEPPPSEPQPESAESKSEPAPSP
ncbi:MAG: Sec-independent protein translocase subunit TatA/TatB [Planctomycetota bacterium]|jgi:sec-independent protein translocase protein TatA